jgi:hypothetical protein
LGGYDPRITKGKFRVPPAFANAAPVKDGAFFRVFQVFAPGKLHVSGENTLTG